MSFKKQLGQIMIRRYILRGYSSSILTKFLRKNLCDINDVMNTKIILNRKIEQTRKRRNTEKTKSKTQPKIPGGVTK